MIGKKSSSLFCLLFVVLFVSNTYAAEDDYIDPQFAQQIKGVLGKKFTGTFEKSGEKCFVWILDIHSEGVKETRLSPNGGLDEWYTTDPYRVIFSLLTQRDLPDSFLQIRTVSQLRKSIRNLNSIGSVGPNVLVGDNFGKSNGHMLEPENRTKVLGLYYHADSFPSRDDQRIYLSEDGQSVVKMEAIDYKDWYIPGIQYLPVDKTATCTIDQRQAPRGSAADHASISADSSVITDHHVQPKGRRGRQPSESQDNSFRRSKTAD